MHHKLAKDSILHKCRTKAATIPLLLLPPHKNASVFNCNFSKYCTHIIQ